MYKFRSKEGVTLACGRAGNGPPLVLVHGTGATAARWTPVLPAFAARFSVYAVDRRGRGESGDAADYAIEHEFDGVACLVDSLVQPVYLLGHSYGGVCALEAARLTPHVHKLVLYEPPVPLEGFPIYDSIVLDRLES